MTKNPKPNFGADTLGGVASGSPKRSIFYTLQGSQLIDKFVPVSELIELMKTLDSQGESLDENESKALDRFKELTERKYFDIARPDLWNTARQQKAVASVPASQREAEGQL